MKIINMLAMAIITCLSLTLGLYGESLTGTVTGTVKEVDLKNSTVVLKTKGQPPVRYSVQGFTDLKIGSKATYTRSLVDGSLLLTKGVLITTPANEHQVNLRVTGGGNVYGDINTNKNLLKGKTIVVQYDASQTKQFTVKKIIR